MDEAILHVALLHQQAGAAPCIRIPIQLLTSDATMRYRDGQSGRMRLFRAYHRKSFVVPRRLDASWRPACPGADDRHPRLEQRMQCRLLHADGRELLVMQRTEVEYQRHDEHTTLLKIGHKDQAVVRFAVTKTDENWFRVHLADVLIPTSFDVSVLKKNE